MAEENRVLEPEQEKALQRATLIARSIQKKLAEGSNFKTDISVRLIETEAFNFIETGFTPAGTGDETIVAYAQEYYAGLDGTDKLMAGAKRILADTRIAFGLPEEGA